MKELRNTVQEIGEMAAVAILVIAMLTCIAIAVFGPSY